MEKSKEETSRKARFVGNSYLPAREIQTRILGNKASLLYLIYASISAKPTRAYYALIAQYIYMEYNFVFIYEVS